MSDPAPAGADGRAAPERERCLLTGASGFIGARVAARLVADGCAVRALVRPSSERTALTELGVETVVGDLADRGSLRLAVEGCRSVIHCAALVSDWAMVREIVETNVIGTRNLLEASVRASVGRFVHLSTTDVYGHPGGRDIGESYGAWRLANWYAQTKREAEHEVRRAQREHALDAVILRPATVYGPGSRDVVGEIASAIRARRMLLIDGGRAVAGLSFVDNVVDAAILAVRHPAAPGCAFNVSDGLDVSWRQFTDDLAAGLECAPVRWSLPYPLANALAVSLEHGYRLLRGTTGLRTAPLLSRQAVQVLGSNQDFSNRRAREVLGWEPRVLYDAGLRATVEWLRSERGSAATR